MSIGIATPSTTAHPMRRALVVGALGVVYGDIGTSPIYTLRECLKAAGGGNATDIVLGLLSLLFWALMIVVTAKYVLFVMRADNDGEGGIMALLGLAAHSEYDERRRTALLMIGLAGAALFYGDGMITPAISVLSAVEGLEVAAPLLKAYVIPITTAVLIGLFVVQSRGSERIGAYFGPMMALWFVVLVVAGLAQVIRDPIVLGALNPRFALSFLAGHGWIGFLALGSVFLALTGAEALYADMGHFGRGPIRLDWFVLVLPALVLNYFGQGALVLSHPEAKDSPFLKVVPRVGIMAGRAYRDRRHGHRVSGCDLGGVLAFAAGHAARPSAALRRPPNLRGSNRAGVCAADQLAAHGVRAWAGALLRVFGQSGRGLWRRGRRHNGDHDDPAGGRSPPSVALELASYGSRNRLLSRRRRHFLRSECSQDPAGRLVPAADRRRRVHADVHVEAWPSDRSRAHQG
jgi:hypothetical protein